MNPNFFKSAFVAGLLLFFIGLTVAHGANKQPPVVKVVTQADILQRIQAIKDKENLSEEAKKRILAAYYESQDNLNELQAQEAQAEAFKQAMNTLPLEAKQLARQITDAETSLKTRKPERLSIFPTDELEQRLIIEKTRLSDLDAEINRVEGQIGDLQNRPQLIREKIAEIKTKQAASQQEQQSLTARGGDNLIEKEARQIQLDTRLRLLNTTFKTLELENIGDPLRLQTQKDRMHWLTLQREQQSMLIADLDNFLLERRQQEIDKEQAALLQAEKDAEGKHPLILAATKQNMQYNRSLQDINKNTEQYLQQKTDIDARYKMVEKDYQSAEQKINLAGLSPALGNLLREQRRNLPRRKDYKTLNDNIQNEIAQTSLEMFKLDEAKKNLTDVGSALLSRMEQQLPADTGEDEKLRIRTELRMLLNDQKDLVSRLSAGYIEYAQVLGDVDFSLQQMLTSADKFGAYLDQRLLWVPSAPVLNEYYLKDIFNSLLWFVSPSNWLQVVVSFWHGIKAFPLLVLVGLGIVALHWRFKNIAKTLLQAILSKNASNQYLGGFGQTLHGLFYIFVLSLYGPLLMVWVGGVLALSGDSDTFSRGFAEGLFAASLSLCAIQFFFRFFKPEGLAEALFFWQHRTAFLVFSQLKWLRFVAVPAIFIVAMTGSDVFSEHSYALGRTALIVMMLAMAYVFHRLTQPLNGLSKSFYLQSQGWISRLRYLWYGVAVLIPLTIIGFAVAGYYQSALELEGKLVVTVRLIFITVLLHALALRWLTITKRQLALQNARQKRKQGEQPAVGSGDGVYPVEETLVDLSKINQQSHKLMTTVIALILLVGCWMIWSDIMPAFSVFDRVVLWQHSQMLEGKESLQPITLTNLLICLAYAGLSFVVVGNFPALVDLLSVGKFEMTPGSRYALIQLVRYVLISIAFLAIANELGGSWSQVQWLVAALSVGLGFGLQEIFANMVSGIILLFERPIRVGDTVTVGEVTGRVSRIQMRATHIVDGDRKELVVPNKIFITASLINWTLSDTVTRIVLPVSVSFGVEVEVVERIFRDAIKSTPLVLQDPEPDVVFNGFGDSSLHFNIQVFVRELKDRASVTHSLHKNIYDALQSNHIEIPFPQRDVHIRSVAKGILPNQAVAVG
ncbi:MAG: mechanosensitive ion channel [Methylococcaceae bacterium]|nr:mechanosensitive ion channel [Methylococcaceae bacterium]